jgi:hypothetical protein
MLLSSSKDSFACLGGCFLALKVYHFSVRTVRCLQNVQQVASNMKKCSAILQDLAKDMDDVNKRITVVQEHSFVTKNSTSPEEATSQDK